nr:MAG TPA: hypothetical protein [Bacteriophage sp.]
MNGISPVRHSIRIVVTGYPVALQKSFVFVSTSSLSFSFVSFF